MGERNLTSSLFAFLRRRIATHFVTRLRAWRKRQIYVEYCAENERKSSPPQYQPWVNSERNLFDDLSEDIARRERALTLAERNEILEREGLL
jgi:hypothetical protein